MAVLHDMAQMTTATTGTGTITLGAALTGFQTFAAAGVNDGDSISYGIADTNNAWEVGRGTYTASGTTLTRGALYSSSGGSPINLSGNAVVYVTVLSEDFSNLTCNTISVGNSTANSFGNSTIEIVANASSQTVITPGTLSIGNSTVNLAANSVQLTIGNSTQNSIFTGNSLALTLLANATITSNTAAVVLNFTSNAYSGLLLVISDMRIAAANVVQIKLGNSSAVATVQLVTASQINTTGFVIYSLGIAGPLVNFGWGAFTGTTGGVGNSQVGASMSKLTINATTSTVNVVNGQIYLYGISNVG